MLAALAVRVPSLRFSASIAQGIMGLRWPTATKDKCTESHGELGFYDLEFIY